MATTFDATFRLLIDDFPADWLGLRYNDDDLERLFQEVTAMEESSTYQLILRKGGIAEARRLIRSAGVVAFGPIPTDAESLLNAIDDSERFADISSRIRTAVDWDDLLGTP